jgi:hypothetical protein
VEEKEVRKEAEGKEAPTDTVLVVNKGVIDARLIFRRIDNHIDEQLKK